MSVNEIRGDGKPVNKPGLYRREDGIEIETSQGVHGATQADAIVQQGFVYVEKTKTETPKQDK